jgi:mannitol/fructose-specific phosphotransferase system IIA component (Ntr-type)
MNLRDKLKEETIILPIQSTTQSDAIQELLVHLQNNKILSATTKLFSYIDNNERTSPCAAGRGVAYPHSTSIEIDKLTCVLGFSRDGIDFNSPDGQLCHIILLTLSPDEDPSEHRKFITRFRTMINNPKVRSQLLETNQPDKIINIIQKWKEDDALIDNLN